LYFLLVSCSQRILNLPGFENPAGCVNPLQV